MCIVFWLSYARLHKMHTKRPNSHPWGKTDGLNNPMLHIHCASTPPHASIHTMSYKDPKDPRQKEAQRQWYLRNKETHKAATKANKEKGKLAWRSFKATLKCALCSENHSWTLDFHHVVRASDNRKVYKLVSGGMYKQAIKEIRERCVVLCANCHRKGHYYEKHGLPLDAPNYSQYEEWFKIKA